MQLQEAPKIVEVTRNPGWHCTVAEEWVSRNPVVAAEEKGTGVADMALVARMAEGIQEDHPCDQVEDHMQVIRPCVMISTKKLIAFAT